MAGEETNCDGIDWEWVNSQEEEDDEDNWDDWNGSAPVKYYTYEMSLRGRLRRLLLRNPSSRLCSTVFDLLVKTLICVLYITRVCLDEPDRYACYGEPCSATNATLPSSKSSGFSSTAINWHVLLWVHRPLPLWIVQVFLAVVTLSKACLQIYVMTKGSRREHIRQQWFLLELFCSLPIIATVCYPLLLHDLFVPIFLNCWIAKMALERLFNDLHLTKQRFQTISVTLSQQMLLLNVTLFCLIFTTICGIQHIQRGSSEKSLNMFESIYFVIVTFSTVGYGDISPDIWLGQLFMFLMICVAFAFIPRQLEEIASTWMQRKKSGGEYSRQKSARNKHVVVCSTSLTTETVMNFLNEFYAHPKLEEHTVVLMSSLELDNNMQMILKDPKWANRVFYIRGSTLKDIDLKRCRINEAEACFFLAAKNSGDRDKAGNSFRDQHTILRSWAVKDFAPRCRQYIQLFKAENKMHVKFSEHVVCEDEFKYALLANNCLYPGLSTLVTLLLHTSRGREGEIASEPWQQVYGRHSGNEVYHIQLNRSTFFRQYDGKKFTEASADAHHRFGVSLVAVLDITRVEPRLQLNPGHDCILKGSDFCFYMGVTREEYSKINPSFQEEARIPASALRNKNIELIAMEIQKWLQSEGEEDQGEDDESVFSTITSQLGQTFTKRIRSGESSPLIKISNGPPNLIRANSELADDDEGPTDSLERINESAQGRIFQFCPNVGPDGFITGPPPSTLYVGTKRTTCHLHKEPRESCCLEWGKNCDHCCFKNAKDDRWNQQLIILTAEYASTGIYNFIVPLRSDFHNLNSILPIILLLEQEPDKMFLETIACFPLVFWMQGKMTSIDDLLTAGVNKATHLVISNKESDTDASEETLADAETVVAVQKITKLFPNANVITELNDASNMRFMQFQAHDVYTQEISRLEKKLKEKTSSNLPHLFRLPFAAGHVFSAGMLDRLLYQTFVKGYLISFVRLLLGIDAQENSGHLSSVRVRRATVAQFPTYGDLYQGLCSTTGEIPIAIYRTERRPAPCVAAKPDWVKNENNNIHKQVKAKNMKSRPSMPARLFSHADKDTTSGQELIKSRMKSLNLLQEPPDTTKSHENTLSYVIVNPSPMRKLKNGDMIYVIQPSSMFAVPNKLKWKSNLKVPPLRTVNFVVQPAKTPPIERSATSRVSWNLRNIAKDRSPPKHSSSSDGRFRSKSESQA